MSGRCPDTTRTLEYIASQPGWLVGRSKNHVKVTAPDGTVLFTSSTPSDNRALRNFRSQLRRLGLETDPKRLNGGRSKRREKR